MFSEMHGVIASITMIIWIYIVIPTQHMCMQRCSAIQPIARKKNTENLDLVDVTFTTVLAFNAG